MTREILRLVGFGGALIGLFFVGLVELLFTAFDRWMGSRPGRRIAGAGSGGS